MLRIPPPLSLYIHIPWCVKKCPYCDFNSHRAGKIIPEKDYIQQLLKDLDKDLPLVWGRTVETIFIGGGTPSLFSADGIAEIISQINARLPLSPTAEITMEANPGTFEQEKFKAFREAGINRLSIGIQSFQDDKLKQLGRIHDANESKHAIDMAMNAGFENINLDLMHGLPNQSRDDALHDLQTAINFNPNHISWYQLTLEPNTVFAKHPPKLPADDALWDIQEAGEALLKKHGYEQYEISAYSKAGKQSQHNLNYWQFGDYLGIGAGAHAKITDVSKNQITRYWKLRNPRDYLNADNFIAGSNAIADDQLPLEFMMNVLRLKNGAPLEFFEQRTGLNLDATQEKLDLAKDFIEVSANRLKPTSLGQRFLNDCLALF